MNPTKILWVQILLVCASVLPFMWAATEWTAWQLAFQPQLGRLRGGNQDGASVNLDEMTPGPAGGRA